jgi:hypothetical protein
MARTFSRARSLRSVLFALGGGVAVAILAMPAAAQFGSIFGEPPRPPSDVPARPPSDVPTRPPARLQQPGPPRAAPVPVQPEQDAGRPAGPQTGIQSQTLPPPPGVTVVPAPPPAATATPTLPAPPGPTSPRNAPQPASTAPQPGDEVITEMPTQRIINPTAVFSGLDKITGRITSFDVAINERCSSAPCR